MEIMNEKQIVKKLTGIARELVSVKFDTKKELDEYKREHGQHPGTRLQVRNKQEMQMRYRNKKAANAEMIEWVKNLARHGVTKTSLMDAAKELNLNWREIDKRYQYAGGSDLSSVGGAYFILTGKSYPRGGYTWASELIKIAKSLVASVKEFSWSYDDRSAPRTPWGPAQVAYRHNLGAVWYSTAGHGGLYLPGGLARSLLSNAALAQGMRSGSGYWYEEDVAWQVVAYEQLALMNELFHAMGGRSITKEEMEKDVRQWMPEYFEKQYDKPLEMRDLQVGFTVELQFAKCRTGEVIENRGRSVVFKGDDGNLYKLTNRSLDSLVKVVRDNHGQVIWEKK